MGTLKAAVIGLGVMGRNHARVYRSLPEIESVMAIDPDHTNAIKNAHDQGMHIVCWDVESGFDVLLKDGVQIASITAPTSLHASLAIRAMELGIHVLVEKPIAHTVRDARNMVDCARVNNCILMVGHIVRYDSITRFIKGLISRGELGVIWRISARRIGPSPDRIRDVGVAVDLATHDIDTMRYILDQDPREVAATVRYRNHGDEHEDQVDGWLEFSGSATGIIEADWLTPNKHRSLVVCGSKGMLIADYVRRIVRTTLDYSEAVTELLFPDRLFPEPLKVEIGAFIHSVINGEPSPVSGRDGLIALRTALAMVESSAIVGLVQL